MIIDGKYVSSLIKNNLKAHIESMKIDPTLAVIQIGNNEASNIYIRNKEKYAKEIGASFVHIKYDENEDQNVVIDKIKELNNDDNINGIIVQLPLPKGFDTDLIVNTIDPHKDVDGLTELSIGKLCINKPLLMPCTPSGIIYLLEYYNIPIESKNVVIVGRSNLVGKPLFEMMLNKNATVTLCHSKTENLKSITSKADILVSAVGKKHIITADMVKKDAVVIDVGINKEDGKLYGDVDYNKVIKKASYITPVPGGVGPMTIAMLYSNLIKTYNLK